MKFDFTKPYIAYVGHMLFPWGQAASRRVYGNAMSFVASGHNVTVVSGSAHPAELTQLEILENGCSLSHVGLRVSPTQNDTPLQKAIKLLFAASRHTLDWLETQPTRPTHIVLYGGYTPYMMRLLPWCRRNNVSLIADVVEWHSASQFTGGAFGLSALNVNIAMRYLYPRCDGIITISSYLSRYYKKRGCPIAQVPPTVDMDTLSSSEGFRIRESKYLTLIYAGSPKNKDLLRPIIDGMKIVDPNFARVRLIVLGPSEEDVSNMCCDGEAIPPSVLVKGRIPQEEVAEILQSADFSVLLRPPLRYADAGFSTKFVESLVNGIPVIANLTGDMGMYLNDGGEGFVCQGYSAEAFAEVLGLALTLSPEGLLQMRLNAHSQAKRSFDYRQYSDVLAELIEITHK
ncbi:glycosyltransferase [uncultured Desulfuromusa sp.]|uniref:glycosyltransferase n=1 Tax=uncultured Desulfuromusa sp. TaxID=219183 RepID=UPI002AA712A3|nr:glycosyltransferase [uncultured Desulfuromusa sp.]